MSNFYGKRFLSSLVGALTVLGSPVASAGKNGSGRGDLGEGVPSANRDKNNGNLGELKSNREVKSIDGLKEVLKETGGKVVRVSPDGKGGFVAFIKTPRGIVTVMIVGVPLIFVLGLVASYVFSGQKNDGAKKKNAEFVVKKASGALLNNLFEGKQNEYNLFVGRLFDGFFNDKSEVLGKKFHKCREDLDRFLINVFKESSFDVDNFMWRVNLGKCCAVVGWRKCKELVFAPFNSAFNIGFVGGVFNYLSKNSFVDLPGDDDDKQQISWGDKISAVLFSFWCLVDYGLKFDSSEVEEFLRVKKLDNLRGIFEIIRGYVKDRLKNAGKGYDGQKLEPVG